MFQLNLNRFLADLRRGSNFKKSDSAIFQLTNSARPRTNLICSKMFSDSNENVQFKETYT